MSFHGALGYVQIASDFRIITALKQQFDDLLLPVSHLTAIFCHAFPLNRCTPRLPQVANRQSRSGTQVLDSSRCILCPVHLRDQSTPATVTEV
jgi:hypothetical protein